jgi:histone deacetylase 1/2
MGQLRRFNMGLPGEADCPVFDGQFEYCRMYSGGSVDGAAALARGDADVCLNWSGGMHHAKKAEASGFCYVNDIVLAILELLKTHARVLYIDIDIHHGDGVEEAFYLTDRVMTVSFHKYGDFFPGTGALGDVGHAQGARYSVNVPLREGMDDASYKMVYEPVMEKVLAAFQPGAVVMCCGADSLSGDRLGCFNLSLQGHSQCIEYVARTGVPTLVLGGGGYTLRNVARCWAYETGRLMGKDLPDELPEKALEELNYYMDNSRLRIAVSNMRNANTRQELERTRDAVLEQLSKLPACPSAGIRENPAPLGAVGGELPEEDPDVRGGGKEHDEARVERDGDGDGATKYDAGGRDADEAALRRAQDAHGHTRGEQVEEAGAAAGGGEAAAAAAAPKPEGANGDAAAAPPAEAPAAAAMEVDAAAPVKPEEGGAAAATAPAAEAAAAAAPPPAAAEAAAPPPGDAAA